MRQGIVGRAGKRGRAVVGWVDLAGGCAGTQVISSIMKQSCTERGRRIVIDGMDILGGAGICRGPNNFAGNLCVPWPACLFACLPVCLSVHQ